MAKHATERRSTASAFRPCLAAVWPRPNLDALTPPSCVEDPSDARCSLQVRSSSGASREERAARVRIGSGRLYASSGDRSRRSDAPRARLRRGLAATFMIAARRAEKPSSLPTPTALTWIRATSLRCSIAWRRALRFRARRLLHIVWAARASLRGRSITRVSGDWAWPIRSVLDLVLAGGLMLSLARAPIALAVICTVLAMVAADRGWNLLGIRDRAGAALGSTRVDLVSPLARRCSAARRDRVPRKGDPGIDRDRDSVL